MEHARHYRAMARQCLALAKRAARPNLRLWLLEASQAFHRLAEAEAKSDGHDIIDHRHVPPPLSPAP